MSAVRSALGVALAMGLLAAAAPAAEKDTSPPKPVVLHVGDSFVDSGFSQALKPRFEALGARYVSQSVTSAYSTTLPRQVRLDQQMRTLRPVLAIVTVGANEMAMPVPDEHAHAVRNITKLISSSSCVWALPPRWTDKETGFRDVMKRESSPCRVHDPEEIAASIERRQDKVHPSPKGGAMWAEHFWAFLMEGRTEGELPWNAQASSDDKSAKKSQSTPLCGTRRTSECVQKLLTRARPCCTAPPTQWLREQAAS